MEANGVYQKAIKELYQKTYRKFEHDEEKAIELFDKLLSESKESHMDDIRRMCREAGYDECASEEISQIYDHVHIYREYKQGKRGVSWTGEMIERLCQ